MASQLDVIFSIIFMSENLELSNNMQNEDSPENKIPFYREIILLIIGASLSLSGSFFVVLLTKQLERTSWEERRKIQLDQKIIETKIELIERTIRILNKVDYIKLNFLFEKNKLHNNKKELDEVLKYRKTITELNSEFITVSSLNNIYFGEKVRDASKEIINATSNKIHWWQVDEKLHDNYINALSVELNYIIK